jgi:hypothetical protein
MVSVADAVAQQDLVNLGRLGRLQGLESLLGVLDKLGDEVLDLTRSRGLNSLRKVYKRATHVLVTGSVVAVAFVLLAFLVVVGKVAQGVAELHCT